VAVYNVDENLTRVLLTAMNTCFMSHLPVLVSVLALVLLQLVFTTTLGNSCEPYKSGCTDREPFVGADSGGARYVRWGAPFPAEIGAFVGHTWACPDGCRPP